MEINGTDCVLEGTPSKDQVVGVIRSFWPHAVVECDEGDENDYFVYKNPDCKKVLDVGEFIDVPEGDMIYVLPRETYITLVIDKCEEMTNIVKAVKALMQK